MGGSVRNGKETIVNWVKTLENVNTIVDVGAGSGTYYNLFVEEFGMLKNARWIGLEVWKPAIEKWGIDKVYSSVINEDARTFDWTKVSNIDLVIMGDVLEHMKKEEAMALVDKVLDHSRYGIISIPVKHWPQGAINDNPYEVHVKDDWSHREVMETFSNYIIKEEKAGKIGVYLLEKK